MAENANNMEEAAVHIQIEQRNRSRQTCIEGYRAKIQQNRKRPKFNNLNVDHIGRDFTVDYYLADFSECDRALTFTIGMEHAAIHPCPKTAASLFASAMCAVVPDLRENFDHCLKINNIKKNIIHIPSRARESGLWIDVEILDSNAVVLLFCLGFLAMFKNFTEANFTHYFDARKKALGGKFAMTPQHLESVKFPFSLQRILEIRSVFAGIIEFKQALLNFMMAACYSTGYMRLGAIYCVTITSCSELNIYVLIYNVFIPSNSPVLDDLEVQDEWKLYAETMAAINADDTPQYFNYFCNPTEEMLLQRDRIPVLAAVAQAIKTNQIGGQSPRNYKATINTTDATVQRLVNLHKEYLRKNKMRR